MKKYHLLLAAALCGLWANAEVTENPQSIKDLLNRIGGTGTSERIETVVDDSYGSATAEKFLITTKNGKPCIKGTTLSAVTTGLGWYLNHTANVNLTWGNQWADLSTVDFPLPVEEEHTTAAKYRYYLNYCTFSYSMSTWTWERWQQEIDWMALHGVNMPLQIVGVEEVWRQMLMQDYGYTQAEASEFVAGPCFMAWFGMTNLQGHGGPNPEWWYERQAALGKKINARMKDMGIEPVLPGFIGMVPSNFTTKTGISSASQGTWCGFTSPYMLTPGGDEFAAVAAKYYARLDAVMGTSKYYSMDPFHEKGGATGGVDAATAYNSIYNCLATAHSDAAWVIQQWQWAGGQWQSVASGTVPQGKLIVLDLYSDGKKASQINSYNGHETVYCNIPNFGARTGFFGRFDGIIDSYFDTARPVSSCVGVGAAPEGIEQVPVIYDLLFEMPWMASKPDAATWMAGYAKRRYGAESQLAADAWELLRTSALSNTTSLQGPHEAIVCSRPALTVNKVSSWGGADIFYDPNDMYTAAYKLLDASLSGANYSFDLTDISRQALTDYSKALLGAIKEANDQGDTTLFEARRDAFLQLILDLDELLNTNESFMLGHWTSRARAMADEVSGTTTADKDWLEQDNARTIISTWGGQYQANSGGLRDYSYREWGGMLRDYYYPRWKQWFDGGMADISAATWYAKEHAWATNGELTYGTTPTGTTAEVAARLLPKYLSPFVSQVDGQGTRYIQRQLTTDLRGKFYDRAKRGETYVPNFTITGTTIAELAVDLNKSSLYEDSEKTAAIAADAPIGEFPARITLADGTVLTYTLLIVEEITEPRTVTVATESASKGTVSIDGVDGTTVTGTDFYTLRAKPTSLYDFSHWTDGDGNNAGTDNPMTYYGKTDATFTAHFMENKWGAVAGDYSDKTDMTNYSQFVKSITLTQNSETTDLYSATTIPDEQFVIVPTRIKAAPGGEFTINWSGEDGLKYLFMSAYCDLNADGTFDPSDELIKTVGSRSAANSAVPSNSVTFRLPYDVPTGVTHIRMRFDGAWSDGYDSSYKAWTPTADTKRFVYEIVLEVAETPTYACTVTAKVNDSTLGSCRTENATNVYLPGEEVIITGFPKDYASVASFIDQNGRELPASWRTDNSITFKAYDNAEITVVLERNPLEVDGWKLNWEGRDNGNARITSVSEEGDPTLDLSKVTPVIDMIDASTFAGNAALTEVTLPDATLKSPGATLHTATQTVAGTENAKTTLTSSISGTTPWVMTLKGSTGSSSYNQWGSCLWANGTSGTNSNYSNGWSQYYLKANGNLVIKWDSASETLFDEVSLLGDFVIISEFNGAKKLVVTVRNSDGDTQTKTLTNSSTMQDIKSYVTCIPSGMNFTVTFTEPETDASLGALFAGCRNLIDIHLPGSSTNKAPAVTRLFTPITLTDVQGTSTPMDGSIDWSTSFDLKVNGTTDGTPYNQWGSCLLSTSSSPFGDNFSNNIQLYLNAGGILSCKWNVTQDSQKVLFSDVTISSGVFSIDIDYDATTRKATMTVTNAAGTSQSSEFDVPESMATVSQFYAAITSGVSMTVSASTKAAAVTGLNEQDGVIYNGSNCVAYPEGRLFNLPIRLAQGVGYLQAQPVMNGSTLEELATSVGTEPFSTMWQLRETASDDVTLCHLNSGHHLAGSAITASGTAQAYAMTYGTGAAKLTLGSTTYDFEVVKSIDVTTPSHGAAIVLPVRVKAPADCSTISAIDSKGATVTAIAEGGYISANTPFILKATKSFEVVPNYAIELYSTTGSVMQAATVATKASQDYFLLTADNTFTRKSSSETIPANTAYVLAEVVPSSLGDSFTLKQTTTTIIGPLDSPAATLYDLQGRRVSHPTRGLYINSRGQKLLIK